MNEAASCWVEGVDYDFETLRENFAVFTEEPEAIEDSRVRPEEDDTALQEALLAQAEPAIIEYIHGGAGSAEEILADFSQKQVEVTLAALARTEDLLAEEGVWPRYRRLSRGVTGHILLNPNSLSTLLEETNRPAWQSQANCAAYGRDDYFPEVAHGQSRERQRREARAKAICQSCPVIEECFESAIAPGKRSACGAG